ncbi:MAG: hypothetical protein BWY79_01045 [Actinobacteria bacterium ADurb.Bin444]|nr:MAG: hypothetical protein BWY79_01045 [Actinobacteria bacterium ADurb.Bin444]
MIAAQNDNAMYGQGCLPTNVVATNTRVANSDPTDTILVRRIITVKPRTTIRLLTGMRPMMTPAVVAIPFPPLPRRKTDQLWPTMAARPTPTLARGPKASQRHTRMGSNPFSMSLTSTTIPSFTPSTRKAFVVPGLPLPCSRTSICLTSLPRKTLGETEPRR